MKIDFRRIKPDAAEILLLKSVLIRSSSENEAVHSVQTFMYIGLKG